MISNNNNSDYKYMVEYKIKDISKVMNPRYQTRYQDSLIAKNPLPNIKIILLRKKIKVDYKDVSGLIEFNRRLMKLFNDVLTYRTIYYENLFNYNLVTAGMTSDEKEEIYCFYMENEFNKLNNLTNEEKDILSFNYFEGKKNKIREIFEYISANIEYLDDNLKNECSKKILDWKSGKCRSEREIADEYFYLLKKLE
jgi:hypothetical protein